MALSGKKLDRKQQKHREAKLAKLCDRGRLKHRAGDLVGALMAYAKVLRLDHQCAFAIHYGALAARQLLRQARGAGFVNPTTLQEVHDICYSFMAEAVTLVDKPLTPEARIASAAVFHNMADMLQNDGHFSHAAEYLHLALDRHPAQGDSWWLLGNVSAELGDRTAANAAWDTALELPMPEAGARYNRSFLRLRRGDYERGWSLYESRFDAPDFAGGFVSHDIRRTLQPWRGEELSGKRVYVYGEQGNGDHLQFARYVRALQLRGAEVAFETVSALHRLMTLAYPDVPVVLQGSPLPRADFAVSTMSCPAYLGTRLETIPAPLEIPDLQVASDDLLAPYLEAMACQPGRLVGIGWEGSVLNPLNPRRSIPADALAQLRDIPGVTFVNLQPGGSEVFAAQLGGIDPTPALRDFAATAAVMQRCDAVVGIDSAVSHLAGSVGVPLHVALSFSADWRWLEDRSDSPWYPSATLYRQASPGDWSSVLSPIRAALTRLVSETP